VAVVVKPPRGILDPAFHYVPSAQTDLRKTFARIRKEQREIAKAATEQAARDVSNVRIINRKGSK
jgi:hypothetical protein